MNFAAEKKCYTTSTLCAVAECEIITFQKWRQRNALFPETVGVGGWSRFSLLDILVVRAIVVLTASGTPAGEAVEIAQTHLCGSFVSWLERGDFLPIIAVLFRAKAGNEGWLLIHADADMTLGAVLEKVGNRHAKDAGIVVDLSAIFDHVLLRLKALRPDTIMGEAEFRSRLAGTTARVLGEGHKLLAEKKKEILARIEAEEKTRPASKAPSRRKPRKRKDRK